jgi:glycosyltransferase involved in cell wall biosynthesis
VAFSQRTRREVHALGVDTVKLLPNGITMVEIEAAQRANRSVGVLFVGRFIAEKNAALLIRAVDELRCSDPDIDRLLVDEGPERESVERLVAQRDLQENINMISFRGCYEEDLGPMKAADVFASPSNREGFGIPALDSLACGTPVVTIAHPQNAVQESVDDGSTGEVCEPTVDGLGQGLRRARDTLGGSACVAAARNYEWDHIAEQAETIFREMA